MIKVNLLPVKKKKKRKPISPFLLFSVALTVLVAAVLAYLVYFYGSRLETKQAKVRENEQKIAALKEKIKSVEDYEQRNVVFQKRKEIIEELGRNKSLPVRTLDEISRLLPPGVWLNSLEVKGKDANMSCTAFTNTDVVNYVNNLKGSALLADVYLQESVQAKSGTYSLYSFKLSFKVK